MITQQLQQYDGRLTISPPKTAHSSRVIALDHTTVAALAAHRVRQQAEAAAFGPGYRSAGSCSPTSTGARWPRTG